MNKIILVSGCDFNYFWRAKIYLSTLNQFSQADENRYYICDSNVDKIHDLPSGKIDYRRLNPFKFRCSNGKCSIQHGEFFDQDDFHPEDIVIWTDSDMRMQRWFYESELEKIRSLKQGEIMLLRNSVNDLEYEFTQLSPNLSYTDFLALLGEDDAISHYRCFNTGVIIAKAATYKRLFYLYSAIEPITRGHFQHGAIQQWVLSYLANKNFKVYPMSPQVHLFEHDYVRTKSGRTSVKDGIVYTDDKPVVFWHCK